MDIYIANHFGNKRIRINKLSEKTNVVSRCRSLGNGDLSPIQAIDSLMNKFNHLQDNKNEMEIQGLIYKELENAKMTNISETRDDNINGNSFGQNITKIVHMLLAMIFEGH